MSFCFHPELFDCRGRAMQELEGHGFSWLSHYSSVDLLHAEYGLEVCGIHHAEDASCILRILVTLFPDWPVHRISYKEYGREIGWKAIVARAHDHQGDAWAAET